MLTLLTFINIIIKHYKYLQKKGFSRVKNNNFPIKGMSSTWDQNLIVFKNYISL